MELEITSDIMEQLCSLRTVVVENLDLDKYGIRFIKDVHGTNICNDTFLICYWNGKGVTFSCAESQIKLFVENFLNDRV